MRRGKLSGRVTPLKYQEDPGMYFKRVTPNVGGDGNKLLKSQQQQKNIVCLLSNCMLQIMVQLH